MTLPPQQARSRTAIVVVVSLVVIVIATLAAVMVYKVAAGARSKPVATSEVGRPPRDTPRGVMWDVWQAAMHDDRDGVRAAMVATNDAEQRAADALADLLVAEARFVRQLQHTWPMSPTSRDGAGTWFGEGSDAALLVARENIDAAAINATINMHGTPVKLTRSGGAWKIVTADLVRTRLKRGNAGGNAVGNADAADLAADLAAAPDQLAAMTKAYRDLTREVAALRIASPSAAVEKLRQSMPAATTQSR